MFNNENKIMRKLKICHHHMPTRLSRSVLNRPYTSRFRTQKEMVATLWCNSKLTDVCIYGHVCPSIYGPSVHLSVCLSTHTRVCVFACMCMCVCRCSWNPKACFMSHVVCCKSSACSSPLSNLTPPATTAYY